MGRSGNLYLLMTTILMFSLIGCVSSPTAPSLKSRSPEAGFYHRVAKGQTLWNISRIYNVDLEKIIKINNISDSAKIEIGQLILIPGRFTPGTQKYSFTQDFSWPLEGKTITDFGSILDDRINKGINIRAANAANVTAARSGRVVFCDSDLKGYGSTIIIDHQDGFQTVYAQSLQTLVTVGQTVAKGEAIAKITPANLRNGYLHFEIRKNGIAQNPYLYLSN